MESLALLVPLSVALVFLIGWAFWRALASGQFDDLERPAQDVLADDDRPKKGSEQFSGHRG
jgi:cbb3-type cytochrome oxidase maturation protein